MIKDIRTKVETKDVDMIYEGNINIFSISFLVWKYL
jgi:hypothetical protein